MAPSSNNRRPGSRRPGRSRRSGRTRERLEPVVVGGALRHEGEIEQAPRDRDPGDRGHRLREWLYLKARELREGRPDLRPEEADREALRQLEALQRSRKGNQAMAAFERLAPTSASVERRNVNDDIELAAVFRLPVVRWLREFLVRRTKSEGRPPNRGLVAAVFMQMAMGCGRPEILATRAVLSAGHALLNWAHDYPRRGPGQSAFYAAIKQMLCGKPPEAAIHANVALLRELAELRGPDGKPLHPDILRVGIVDAKGVEADTRQIAAKDEGHRRLLRRAGQKLVKHIVYTRNGSLWRFWVGYKLCVLADMASTLPICWCLVPASASERDAARAMLEMLFEIWPDCPMEALVGDSLYDHEEQFAFELVFDWGIQPVFVRHGKWSRDLAWARSEGVPQCACGNMSLYDTDQFYTAARRAKEGIPRGVRAPRLDARLRWRCPNDIPTHRPVYTRPIDNPRLYTFYPRAGEHRRAYERQAMLLRRNAIESIFSSLQDLGLAGRDQERPAWAEDVETAWLLSCGLFQLTARRVAHETGMYEAAYAEAEMLGLLEQPSLTEPAPGPDEFTLARARRDRVEIIGEARRPESWPEDEAAELPGLGEPSDPESDRSPVRSPRAA